MIFQSPLHPWPSNPDALMAKHRASQDAGAGPPLKQLCVETDARSSDSGDGDGDTLSAPTPSSTSHVASPATAATTPRPRFPSDLKSLACTWPGCSKAFNRPARLRDHLNSHTKCRPFKCLYAGCDKDYIEDKHLKQHIKAVHTHERNYICHVDGCGKSFVTGTRLKRHQAVHEGADRFRCVECGQSFRKKETLHKHARKEHMNMPAHECPDPDCAEAFDSKPRMRRHFDKMHGEIKLWCSECDLRTGADGTQQRIGFTTEPLLLAHLKREHQNCIFCDFQSSSRCEMEQHVETRHSGKTVEERKTHACWYQGCTKRFTSKSSLRTHIRSAHLGVRFVCGASALTGPGLQGWSNDQGCGDAFSTKARLRDHVRFMHLGHERPKLSRPRGAEIDAVDDLSGATLQAKNTVPCPHCDAMFARYFDLDVHLAKAHGPTVADPASPSLAPAHVLFPDPLALDEQTYDALSTWSEPIPQLDMFTAATADDTPPSDDLFREEAGVLLLAHSPSVEPRSNVDPVLSRP